MAKIKSRNNGTTERKFRALLVANGISGWKIHPPEIEGKPDFCFPLEKIAIFIDGCFWHGCRVCNRRIPKTNREFWKKKIQNNVYRDEIVNRILRRKKWIVIRVWEHELRKNRLKVVGKLLAVREKCSMKKITLKHRTS